jgi:Putative collagen-binding domain of a collagenase
LYEGVELEGAAQVGYLRRFYESLPWTSLDPAPDLFQTNTGMSERYFPPSVSADRDRRTVVVYLGENYRLYADTALLTGLRDNVYRVRWFDPRLGEWLPEIDPVTPTAGRLMLPPTPRVNSDWVLAVTEYVS